MPKPKARGWEHEVVIKHGRAALGRGTRQRRGRYCRQSALRDGVLLIVLAAATAAVGAGCRPMSGPVAVWIVDGSPHRGAYEPVTPHTGGGDGTDNTYAAARVDLSGAVNETLDFSFAVEVGDAPLTDPSLRVAPFRSISRFIDSSVVQLFRMQRVTVGDFPGWHIRSIPPVMRDHAPLDVLVPVRAPRGGLPAVMVPGKTYFFWVDIIIPKGTFEGVYNARIELASGGASVAGVDMNLTVLPLILPDESEIPMIAEVDHHRLFRHHVRAAGGPAALNTGDWRESARRSEMDALLRSTLQMLRSHRLTPVLHRLEPRVSVDARARITLDWEHYDAVVGPYIEGTAFFNRLPLELWPLPVDAVYRLRSRQSISSSLGQGDFVREYLSRSAQHFADKGWLEKSYAMFPKSADSGSGGRRRAGASELIRLVDSVRNFAATARRVEQHIPIALRFWPQDMGPYGWNDYPDVRLWDGPEGSYPDVDIWIPPAQFFDREVMAAERAAGRRTWLAVDRPPFSGSLSVHAPPGYVRVLTWQAERLGAQALYLGCVNSWPEATEHPTPEDCTRADTGVLLYPGGPFGLNEPVPSVRLKRLRRSLQDEAYRMLLDTHGLEHVGATLSRSLVAYAGAEAYRTHFADGRPIGWADDPELFDLARDIMVDSLINVLRGNPPRRRSEQFAANAAWRRFMLTARRLDMYVDGTRVRLQGPRSSIKAVAECAVTIVNRKRVPVTGTARFAELPAGWVSEVESWPVETIPPNSSRRVTLVAHVTMSSPDAPGFPGFERSADSIPIRFTSDDGNVHGSEARLALVTAVPLVGRRTEGARWSLPGMRERIRAPAIDGDLSDWPPGAINVASGFRLIAGSVAQQVKNDGRRPQHTTIAFVMRDDENLYIAVNCAGDAHTHGGTPRSRYNRVDYSDLVPVGDELVEVLFDPLNAGTRSPADLYHIAVKPSGTYLLEKGIKFDPPCGAHAPWPARIEVATGSYDGRWTVELRIPFDSFEVGEREHTVWGFNITRYDASGQEFSTWSGASGNAYDPLSLGNLYLP